MPIYKKCPTCSAKLEPIQDKDGYVIDYRCSKCGIGWDHEDLEYEETQKTITDFTKDGAKANEHR